MRFNSLYRILHRRRHRHSLISATHLYFHASPLPPSNPNSSTRSRLQPLDPFKSALYSSRSQSYGSCNFNRIIGVHHVLLQNSCFSSSAFHEKEEKPKCSEVSRSWVDVYLPEKARPYAHLARLDKPIGTWLLAWPCMW